LLSRVILERSEGPALVHHLLQIRELHIEFVERLGLVSYCLLPIVILERSERPALVHHLLKCVSSLSNLSNAWGE
jgi:hypothetical protein